MENFYIYFIFQLSKTGTTEYLMVHVNLNKLTLKLDCIQNI